LIEEIITKEETTAADLLSPIFLNMICCKKPSCLFNTVTYNGETCQHCKKECRRCRTKLKKLPTKSEIDIKNHRKRRSQ
jgi:hypothetical protein